MNPVELYKKLPKKNCGECAQKACMPFALSAIKGDTDLSGCPRLTEGERDEIRGSLTQSDWREELILKLREEIRGISFADVAEGIGASLIDDSLVIPCMGREFRIGPDGEIVTVGHMTPWIKILLLHYIRTAGKAPLAGRWISYGELRSGMVKASSFHRECEAPLRDLLERDRAGVERILGRLGAEARSDFPTSYAWHMRLLPKMPAVILYWPGEEEFEPKVKILFDASADKFLDVESIIFLLEGLVKNIENNLLLDKN